MSSEPLETPPEEDERDGAWSSVQRHVEMGTEHSRMQAVLKLSAWEALTPEAVDLLRQLTEDASRSVRVAARDVLKAHGFDLDTADATRLQEARVEGRSNALLALISLGSTGTGILITALSFLSFYTLKRFPFPEPLVVLSWANALFTLPFIIVAVLMIFPGRAPRAIAGGVALLSLLGSTLLMMTAQRLFESYWAFQFTAEKAADYAEFLSPFRVGFMLLPIIVGQSILLFYLSSSRHAPKTD